MDNKDVILIGPPGSGKGTQADLLASTCGLLHLSSGDLFRENVRNGTPLGKLAKDYMDRGEYVPDDVTVAMVVERMQRPDAARGVIFDGFPRTEKQAAALKQALAEHGRGIKRVIVFQVPDREIVTRLSARRVCPKDGATFNLLSKPPKVNNICDNDGAELVQRDDDKPETIERRLEVYHRQTAPLVSYYQAEGLVSRIDGSKRVESVLDDIRSILG